MARQGTLAFQNDGHPIFSAIPVILVQPRGLPRKLEADDLAAFGIAVGMEDVVAALDIGGGRNSEGFDAGHGRITGHIENKIVKE